MRADCGIASMQTFFGVADPMMQRIAPFIELPALPVWLTAAQAQQKTPWIRRVFDHLGHSFRAVRLDP